MLVSFIVIGYFNSLVIFLILIFNVTLHSVYCMCIYIKCVYLFIHTANDIDVFHLYNFVEG